MSVETDFKKRLLHESNLTIQFDGWTDVSNKSVYAVTVSFRDRSSHLLATLDLTLDSHTADHLLGEFGQLKSFWVALGFVVINLPKHDCVPVQWS